MTRMTSWEVLGIEPTDDVKQIKSAYARKLKIYHPEEDPEGFQHLRLAYEEALESAKNEQESQEIVFFQEEPVAKESIEYDEAEEGLEEGGASPFIATTVTQDDTSTAGELANQFMDQVAAIYEDFFARIQLEHWKQLLEREEYWNLDVKQIINERILDFFMGHFHMPQAVWRVLNEHFYWTEQQEDLYAQYPESFVRYLIRQIEQPGLLRYDCFNPDIEMDYDAYLEHREEAYYALIRNDLDSAGEALSAASQIYTADPDLLRLIGQYYLRFDDTYEAFKAFDRLVEAFPEEIDGYKHRGRLFLKMGETKKALLDFNHVLNVVHTDPDAKAGIAQCYFASGQFEEAKALYSENTVIFPYALEPHVRLLEINQILVEKLQKQLELSPKEYSLYYPLAQLYFEMGQYEECSETLDDLDLEMNLTSEMHFLWGQALIKQNQVNKGIKRFDQALELARKEGKDRVPILFQRGLVMLEIKEDYEAAIHDLSEAEKLNPQNAEVLHHLAEAYRYHGEHEKGIQYSDRAIAIDSSRWIYYSTRGLCHYALKNYAEARDDHAVVVENDYQFTDAWIRKGNCHLSLGEFEEAIECFQTVMGWSDVSITHFNISLAQFKMNNITGALESIQHYISLEPEDADGHLVLGDIYRVMGDMEKACVEYCHGSDLNPQDDIIALAAAQSLYTEKKHERILIYLERIPLSNPNFLWVLLTRVWVHLERREWLQALKLLNLYVKHAPIDEDDPYASIYGGVITYYMGKPKLALETLTPVYEAGIRGDACSVLSMIYFDMGQMDLALRYAREALNSNPEHPDYLTRYEGILTYQGQKPKRFTLFQQNKQSSRKRWPMTVSIDQHRGLDLPKFHFLQGVGEEDE